MRRIEAYLSGAYRPMCVLDVEYDGKAKGTIGEEALMIFLRLITDARPPVRLVAANSDAQPIIAPDLSRQAAPGR